jgi:hypothetical protein
MSNSGRQKLEIISHSYSCWRLFVVLLPAHAMYSYFHVKDEYRQYLLSLVIFYFLFLLDFERRMGVLSNEEVRILLDIVGLGFCGYLQGFNFC